MGGNVVINGTSADKIDLNRIDRQVFRSEFATFIGKLNEYFNRKFNQPLFPINVMHKDCLSGSSRFIFDDSISIEELLEYKPTFGDMDVMVPKETRPNLEIFLTEFEGITYGNFRLIGFKNSNSQLISLWYYTTGKINVQIDFEFVDFDGINPSDWARFSHYSDWNDTKLGIKASMHKFLIQAIAGYHKEEMIVMSGKKRTPKTITKSPRAFSVTHGLRQRFIQQDDDTWIELTTEESNNITNIGKLFSNLFTFERMSDDSKVSMMYSFNEICILLRKFPITIRERIVDDFAERIFGKGAQKTVRDDKQQDFLVKVTALEYLVGQITFWTGFQNRYEDLIEVYYDNY
jgi:hypothetical protein